MNKPVLALKNSSAETVLLLLIKTGVFLIFLTPLIIFPFTFFPSVFGKVIFFRILVEIIFCAYLLLLFFNRKYRPKISLLFIALLVYIEVLTLATLKGLNPYRGFWGTTERMEGLLMYFHLFLFFVVLVGTFKKKDDWLGFLRFFVLVSVAVAFAGLCQKLGIYNFFVKPDTPNPGPLGPFGFLRPSATLANPDFYGSYLVFVVFLSFFLGIFQEEKKDKIISFSLLGLNFFMLLLVATRAAWVGVFCGAVFLVASWLFFISSSIASRLKVLAGVLGLLLLFLCLMVLTNNGFLKKPNFLYRYDALFENIVDATKNSRVLVWELGLKAFKQKPLLGFGLESINPLYTRYYEGEMIRYIPEQIFFDRTHNKVIDTMVVSGIIGLISYLFIFGSAVFLLLKHKDKTNPFLSFILIGLLIAYFVQNLFSFDMVSTHIAFILILAFIDRCFAKEGNELNPETNVSQPPLKERQQKLFLGIRTSSRTLFLASLGIRAGFFTLIIFSTVTAIYFLNLLPTALGTRLIKGERLYRQWEIEKGINYIKSAFLPGLFSNLEYNFFSVAMLEQSPPFRTFAPRDKEEQKLIFREVEALAKSLENYYLGKPEIREMESYLVLIQTYKDLYTYTKEKRFLKDEERIIGKALRLNPEFAKISRFAGELRFLQGDEESGKVFLMKAYSYDKDLGLFYEWLANSLLESGKEEQGLKVLRRSFKLQNFYTKEKFNLNTIWQIAKAYEQKKNYPEMARFYEEVISLYPKDIPLNPQLYASLATVYAELGEKEKAREIAQKLFRLFPELRPQSEEFLRGLEETEK